VGFESSDPGTVNSGDALVLDNSVAMRWLVASGKAADQQYAIRVRDYIQAQRLRVMVPYLWTYEAAHVAARYANLGELEYGVAANALTALHELCSIIIDREAPLALFEFADRYGVSAYDAAYLMLARSQSLPLATVDRKMRRVAKKLRITVFGVDRQG